jgi:hypothetical protein
LCIIVSPGFSLAAIFSKGVNRVMDLDVEQEIPDPDGQIDGLLPGLRTLILKSCARDPERRYRNIS